MARNVAAFNLPARVGQLFGVSLERLSTSRAVLLTSAAGHTGNIARARSLAEVALRAYVEDWRELSDEQDGDG